MAVLLGVLCPALLEGHMRSATLALFLSLCLCWKRACTWTSASLLLPQGSSWPCLVSHVGDLVSCSTCPYFCLILKYKDVSELLSCVEYFCTVLVVLSITTSGQNVAFRSCSGGLPSCRCFYRGSSPYSVAQRSFRLSCCCLCSMLDSPTFWLILIV